MSTLAINRRFMYVGLFLVALGGVLVAVDVSAVETSTLGSALRLWPIALIAVGAGIALRRSRFALVAGILAAMIPGLVLGGGLVIAPRHGLDCAAGAGTAQPNTQRGTFSAPGSVTVEANCGSISIGTRLGSEWQLTSSSTTGRTPDVALTEGRLSISSRGADHWGWLDEGRETWNLTLPTSQLEQVFVTVNAGRASVALPGATIGMARFAGNAAEITADLSSASVAELDGSLDFGRLAIQLPRRGGYAGAIRIGAGELRLCVPTGLGVHVDLAGTPREVRVNGLRMDARSWENDLYQSTTNKADLSVKVSFGTVSINPVIGGCK
jgi:hypothetical protein